MSMILQAIKAREGIFQENFAGEDRLI
jgi:hypothetical protein